MSLYSIFTICVRLLYRLIIELFYVIYRTYVRGCTRVVTRRIHSPMMCELGGQSGHQWKATRWMISTWFGKESMVITKIVVDVMDSVYIYTLWHISI